MPKFQPAIDIWSLDDQQRQRLQPGQWVFCGQPEALGRFYGQGACTVVAHLNGHRKGYRGYCATIRDYGRSVVASAKARAAREA